MPLSLHPASLPRQLRLRTYDVLVAVSAPFLAFWLRGGRAGEDTDTFLVYVAISIASTILSLIYFKTGTILFRFFSTHDVIRIGKVCAAAIALTIALSFTINRLDLVPRSVPLIHFLLLFVGLAGLPFLFSYHSKAEQPASLTRRNGPEMVLIIGANRIAWFYIQMVEKFSEGRQRIVGLLDSSTNLLNKTLAGHSIIGAPMNLARTIDEYAVHGVRIHRVMVANSHEHYSKEEWLNFEEICSNRQIQLASISDLLAIDLSPSSAIENDFAFAEPPLKLDEKPIWRIKRAIDFLVALLSIIVLMPVIASIALAVRLTIGAPVVFWQQRQGLGGASILVYKFRSLHAPFDSEGRALSDEERLSKFGALLRLTRLDELPQLFNLLSGEMSLIGPRPLLPIDQPKDYARRLSVRPGITGWAQVNGGKLVSAEDKRVLDEWYIDNVSLKLDFIIALRTLKIIFGGDKMG